MPPRVRAQRCCLAPPLGVAPCSLLLLCLARLPTPPPPLALPAGVQDLGGLVKSVLLRMMLRPCGPRDLRRLTKALKQAAPSLSPFSLWLLRQATAGGDSAAAGGGGPTLAQRQAERAQDEAALGASIDRLFEAQQEQVCGKKGG